VLGVVDSGGRGLLLGGRDAEFPCGVDEGPARRSMTVPHERQQQQDVV